MNKTIIVVFSFVFILIISLIVVLSTTGIKTEKFNNFISQKIKENNKKIELDLEAIQFKLDLKEASLFLETDKPKIYYRNILIPSNKIKVYLDFLSIIKSEVKIKKVNLSLDQISVNQLKILSKTFKPSNFQSFVKNKLIDGRIDSEIEFYLDKGNTLNNFIARGQVSNLRIGISKDLELKETYFSFFADRTDILLKNFFGKTELFSIKEGDLKADLTSEIKIESNFLSNINLNKEIKKLQKLLPNLSFIKNLSNVKAELNNSLILNFDKTYKLKNFNYKNNGKIINANFDLNDLNFDYFTNKNLTKLSIFESAINTNFNSQQNLLNLKGKYSLNEGRKLDFDISQSIKKKLFNLKFSADYDELLDFELINYSKKKGDVANISFDLIKDKYSIKMNQINYKDGKNSFILSGAEFSNGKLLLLDQLLVKTFKDDEKNNDFLILFENDIFVKGKKFDASNLQKVLNKKSNKNIFSNISKNIEINLNNIIIPVSEKLENFKLIGKIEKGQFVKISSKGDFGNNNFLDITMKSIKKDNKKYLEIYSDLTKPLLTDYNFFKGLSGGNLLFSSVIEKNSSTSKLKIEKFKVTNAPGMVKLLSLADLGGLADLAEGEGISFDILEINMEKNQDTLKLNEILALGPSISVIMEGYQTSNLTSLRGTLVPAKTLNKMISKIPVIGDIVIPKEVGEGLFGISFKMKGPPGKIKTTINPIKTITPRFIQKIIDRKKIAK